MSDGAALRHDVERHLGMVTSLLDERDDLLATLMFVKSDPCFSVLGTVTQDVVLGAIAKAEAKP